MSKPRQVSQILMSFRCADMRAKISLAGRMARVIGSSEQSAICMLGKLSEILSVYQEFAVVDIKMSENKTTFSLGASKNRDRWLEVVFSKH